jgi:hypothetical protein
MSHRRLERINSHEGPFCMFASLKQTDLNLRLRRVPREREREKVSVDD